MKYIVLHKHTKQCGQDMVDYINVNGSHGGILHLIHEFGKTPENPVILDTETDPIMKQGLRLVAYGPYRMIWDIWPAEVILIKEVV